MLMATERMTFSIPDRVKKKAKKRRDINWSAVVAQAMERKLAELEIADKIAQKSRLTTEDVEELAEILDSAMAKHFGAKS